MADLRIYATDPGVMVQVKRVDRPEGHQRGRMLGYAILAHLEGEPVESATLLAWCVGRPRKDVERIVDQWLDGNRGKLAVRLAEKRSEKEKRWASKP